MLFITLFFILLVIHFSFMRKSEGPVPAMWRWTWRPLMVGCLPVAAMELPVEEGLASAYGIGLAVILLTQYLGAGSTGKQSNDQHRRGAKLLDAEALAKLAGREQSGFKLGQVPIPRRVEPFHFLISGGSGSGKSQAFHQMLGGARQNKQPAVVVDVGGEFASKYFSAQAGDIILNPADLRCANWSPLAEMRSEFDADTLAKSLCPDKQGPENEWQQYGQTLISAVLLRLFESGTGTNGELVRLLTVVKNDELAKVVEGLPAQTFFDEGASRMLASVRAIIASYIRPLTWLDPNVGEDGFSIRKHITAEQSGWLFLPVQEDQVQTFKPLVAAMVDVAIQALLSMSPSSDRRLWFVIDEFATWGRIQSIDPLLTKARKNGGCGALGVQSVAQLRETYGKDTAQTLMSCLGTWLTLRANDEETAEFMSKYIGEAEIRRVTEGGNRDSKSWNEQIAKQRVVMPSQLQKLKDLHGILSIVGEIPAGWVTVPVSKRPAQAERYLPKQRQRVSARPVETNSAIDESDIAGLLDEPDQSR